MRRQWLPGALIAVGAIAFLAYGSLKGHTTPKVDASSSADFGPGVVDTVWDGDTIHLNDGRRVRLVQIDAPEVRDSECYAKEATDELARLAPLGSTVSLRADPALDRRDRFGRILAYVYKGTANLNLRLAELGAAAPYFYRGDRGRYAERLLAAARRAKAEKRGLWGACPRTRLDPSRAVDAVP